ncbi:AAA family ATPase [Aeromicrobium sp. YIM 150415]|uniref:AAA family ATPase n=1 Tax=Aeromicrobium sp. YIM 150415 TaxID=2803912 RepID=UPI0027DC22F5|nr:AAA family ATPase [Aeromicrobium sp. YIM 150415]
MAERLRITEEFASALSVLEAGGHLFVTGKAGTGKSTLIRHFLAGTERNVVVAAPTGIAALNVGGYTLHRLFGFTSTTGLEDVRGGRYSPGRFTKALKALDTLIVDEASMVRADVFDMMAAALERFGPRPGEPFGGVQVVLVGDLFQLPPVVQEAEAAFFSSRYSTPYFFSADAFDRSGFPTVSLSHVFRQQGDEQLTSILNAIREGVLVDQAREDLNARVDPDFVPPADEFWLTLATTNRIVTARNRERLALLPGEELEQVAQESGDLGTFDPPTDRVIRYKVGAQVMMLNNDQAGRWVNGTLGRIVDAGPDGEVTVELSDGARVEVEPHVWEVTRPVVDGGSLRHEVVGTYRQLPLKLAWAITIHKSQGQTLERLVVDLTGGTFDVGQVYVALSRATSTEGLVLKRPVFPRDLKTDRRVMRFLHEPAQGGERRFCAFEVAFVGDEGRMSRPRPVEIAVAFDDGTSVSTLINPERDLAGARSQFAIAADDVLLAPRLVEAWAVLAPLLEGYTPVGPGIDEVLGKLDFELKRGGVVVPMPLGVDVPLSRDEVLELRSADAVERAEAVLAAHLRRGPVEVASSAFEFGESSLEPSYLLPRVRLARPPGPERLPTISAIVQVSTALGELLLDGAQAGSSLDEVHAPVVREAVAARLASVVSSAPGVSPGLVERLRGVERYLRVSFVDGLLAEQAQAPGVADVLVPGARVCFTGTAMTPGGRVMSREEMTAIAVRQGLSAVDNVTKTRCDVLVVAELGTQSGKARKAKQFGKPVLSAEEFFAWAGVS